MELTSDRRYHVPAAPAAVWSAFERTEQYQAWWPWLREFHAAELATGAEWRCCVRPPLPYSVRFTVVLHEVDRPHAIGARVVGDVTGTARIALQEDGGGCEIRLTSTLSPHGRAVRWMAGVARPIARIGHDWVLDTGARQFAARVSTEGRAAPGA